jgi:hypothetical protein
MPSATLDQFVASLHGELPDTEWPPLLVALWWDGKGEWDRAHGIAQEVESAEGAWVHAHLHRKEGDEANAGYWYRRAGKPLSRQAIEAEWQEIVQSLIARM